MKNVYKLKNGLQKKVRTGLLVLTILFAGHSLNAQDNFFELGFLGGDFFSDPTAFIKSLWYNSNPQETGMIFTVDNEEVMRMTSEITIINKPLFMNEGILFNNPDPEHRRMAGISDIIGIVSIQGYHSEGLIFKGDESDKIKMADLFISGNGGRVGIGNGTNEPNGALHVVGLDNDGSTAGLTIDDNRGQRMLLDGNEIDAINNSLNLQFNTDFNLTLVNGGGNVSIGHTEPAEKLHVSGNLRLDNGIFLSNEAMTFRAGGGSDTSNNSIIFQNNAEIEIMRINKDGNVGIGTSTPSQKLEVDGTVKANSFVSSASSFPDYVFEADYNLLTLDKVDAFVKANKHLPNMPSEKEVVENGLDVTEVVVKSVENIENIYLHLIQLNEKMEALEKENAELKSLLKN